MNTIAQKPDWIRNSVPAEGSYGDTFVKRVAIHPDGSVFVLGQYSGNNWFGDQLITTPTNVIDDAFLAKYSPSGDVIWIKQLFKSQEWYSNRVLDLKVDHQGNLLLSGSCLWPSSILGSAIGTGPFLAKIDKQANLMWINFQPTTSLSDHDISRRGSRIGFDPQHNVLWLTDQGSSFSNTGGLVVTRYKYDDGTQLSKMTVTYNPSFYRPVLQDFSVDTDGNFIISGNIQSYLSFSGGPTITTNDLQFFVAKFSTTGKFLWVVNSNSQRGIISSHTTDQLGNTYVALQVSAGTTISTPHGLIRIATTQRPIARIKADGKLDWLNPVVYVNVEDIHLAPDGLLYVTGTSFGSEFRYQSYVRAKEDHAAFILKVSTEGNFHGFYVGEPQDDTSTSNGPSVTGYQSVVDANSNIYTVGGFWDKQIWSCVPAETKNYAFFLVKHLPTNSPTRTVEGPETVCEGTEITLTTNLISNGVLYKWFTPDNNDNGPGAILNNSIKIMAKEAYHRKPAIVSITDGCNEYFAEPYVFTVPSPPQKPQFLLSKSTVCPGASEVYTIAAVENKASYEWSVTEGILPYSVSSVGGTFTFSSDFSSGNIKISVANFCGSNETTIAIGTYKMPEVPILLGDQEICPGVIGIYKSIKPVANAVSYEWDLPPKITFNSLQNSNSTELRATVSSDFEFGEIKVRAVGQCKKSEASLPIIIKRAPLPGEVGSMAGPTEICTTEGNVRYSIPPISTVTQYTWTIPAIFDKSSTVLTTQPYIDLKVKSEGTGQLLVYGKNECKVSSTQVSASIKTYKPLMNPLLEISACDREIMVRDAEDFSWYLNGIASPHLSGNKLILVDSGTYQVEVKNFCGTKRSNVIRAYPVLHSNVLIPNVITPNGDGKNDYLTIDKSLRNSSVYLVNRWGNSVYSSSSYQNNWSADELASGTYFLVVRNQCLPEAYKGWLSVIKD